MKILFLALALLLLLPCQSASQEKARIRLVVQQNGQALVSELRPLKLSKGLGAAPLEGLPATLDVSSLQVRSKSAPGELDILDLALDEELLSPATLLKRRLGKTVTLVLPDGKTRDGRIQKQATVLSCDETPLFLIDGAVYAGPVESILYPEIPPGLAAKPRLTLQVDNRGPAKQTLDLTYIAREISWRMDYVLTLNKAGSSGLLSGWAAVTNRSGADFADASVELLAGEPRSANLFTPRALFAAEAKTLAAVAAPAAHEELFEYHLYKLKRPLSLANMQTRQTPLFASATIPTTRRLVGRAQALPSGRESEPLKERLDALVSFRNSEALGLGLPLPRGLLRAYQDEDGARRFLGEAQLDRTPVGSTAELRLGQAFDLGVERVVTLFEKTGKDSFRAAWELRIRNAKKQAQRIVLQEQMQGKWKMETASRKWTKPSAGVLEFVLDVPPTGDGEPFVLTYAFSTEL